MKNFFQKKPPHGSLSKEFRKFASTTHLDNPMAEHYPNHNLSEEVKSVTPFISLSPSLEHKPYPFGHQNIVLDGGRDSTLILNVISLESKKICTMDILFSPTCPYEDHNHLSILILKLFKRMVVDAFVYHKYCKSPSCIVAQTLQLEQKCSILCGEVWNNTTNDSCKMKFPRSSL